MGNLEIFERMAADYDTPERRKYAKLCADEIRSLLKNSKDKTAIDFGCGTGLVGLELVEDFRKVTFVDSAKNMVACVLEKLAANNINNADALVLDLEKEEAEIAPVDYIFMTQVLLHIKEVLPILKKLSQLLNSGGHLIIIDFDKNELVSSDMVHAGFEQNELSDLLSQLGFDVNESRTFYRGEKIFMGKDASLFIIDAILAE
ncbi:methyltransferase [Eubacteriales bacterium OttesenSCG-928-K08]|nr:methyltransferase [Eubacteriales bacterium OttesenSCG-928-K08]